MCPHTHNCGSLARQSSLACNTHKKEEDSVNNKNIVGNSINFEINSLKWKIGYKKNRKKEEREMVQKKERGRGK